MSDVERRGPLCGYRAATARVDIRPAAPASRLSLRAGTDALDALSAALQVPLPRRPKTSISAGTSDGGDDGRSVHALWLGPDEWLLIDETGKDLAAMAANAGVVHSAVDISHRNTAIVVSGEAAEAVLNAGCPQDLSLDAFPAGACSRTVFGKAEIVLWRRSVDEFRVECWRSFADYVFSFLEDAARDTRA